MIALYVDVPVACFRQGFAREYLSTEALPPPSTCYGFLLSMVGEIDRNAHTGCRVTAGLFGNINRRPSVVLRKVWRVRDKKLALGKGRNSKPDFQQLHTENKLAIWLDSSDETASATLEQRVAAAMENPSKVERFGGLCLGESTHLVNEVVLLDRAREHSAHYDFPSDSSLHAFLLREEGSRTLPVWVDHVGAVKTRFAVGDYVSVDPADLPLKNEIPQIASSA